jgi:uncharacterized membrane protein
MSAHKRRNTIIGSIACVIFALLSLAFGFHMSMQVQRMESVGVHADAIVTGIETGAKNSKTAIVAFNTEDDVEIETECIFQMFVIRHDTGDEVTVLYDPGEPESVMIDNGIWNWDQPIFGLLGGFGLLGLALLILRS